MTLAYRKKFERRTILGQLDSISSVQEMLEFQIKIAELICTTESEIRDARGKANDDNIDELKWHLIMLRCFGDCIAWMNLNPHAIRQLRRSSANKPYLLDMKKHLDFAINIAADYAERNVPAIISDITNCLRIGDIVLATDPMCPGLVEVKTGKKSRLDPSFGRNRRQMSMMKSCTDYLKNDYKYDANTSIKTRAISTDVQMKSNWDIVEKVTMEALENGSSYHIVSDGHAILAKLENEPLSIEIEAIKEIVRNNMKGGFLFSSHARFIERDGPLMPPPAVWPICHDAKLSLMETDVMLGQIIFPNAFLNQHLENGRISDYCIENEDGDYIKFSVDVNDHKVFFSSWFYEEVAYRFATIDSVVQNMIDIARRSFSIATNIVEQEPTIREPRVSGTIHVENIEQVNELLKEFLKKGKQSAGFVSMPLDLYDEIVFGSGLVGTPPPVMISEHTDNEDIGEDD